jgi:adenosine deaminase
MNKKAEKPGRSKEGKKSRKPVAIGQRGDGMSRDFFALPKAEVHVHLEGCFEIDDIVRLAEENGEALPRPRDRLLHVEGGLSEFLQLLDWICGLVRTREQLARAAYDFSRRMRDSGAHYADVIVNPTHWGHWRERIPDLIAALDAGFSAAEQDGLPPVGLCISLLRTQSAQESIHLVDILVALRHPRVVALSIDGNEAAAGRTGPRFAEAFRRAGAAGLKRTVHAGESSDAGGVWDAVQLLGADRIDHGVRAIEDEKLVALLAERRIPLGVCPGSNLTLGLYPTLREHPIEKLRKAGVPVSVNTDDPALLGRRLDREYAACAEAFAWSDEEIRGVARTSIEASFASPDLKARLLEALSSW